MIQYASDCQPLLSIPTPAPIPTLVLTPIPSLIPVPTPPPATTARWIKFVLNDFDFTQVSQFPANENKTKSANWPKTHLPLPLPHLSAIQQISFVWQKRIISLIKNVFISFSKKLEKRNQRRKRKEKEGSVANLLDFSFTPILLLLLLPPPPRSFCCVQCYHVTLCPPWLAARTMLAHWVQSSSPLFLHFLLFLPFLPLPPLPPSSTSFSPAPISPLPSSPLHPLPLLFSLLAWLFSIGFIYFQPSKWNKSQTKKESDNNDYDNDNKGMIMIKRRCKKERKKRKEKKKKEKRKMKLEKKKEKILQSWGREGQLHWKSLKFYLSSALIFFYILFW